MIEFTEKQAVEFFEKLKPKTTKEQQHEENKKKLLDLHLLMIGLERIKHSLSGDHIDEHRRITNRTKREYNDLKFTIEAYERNLIRQSNADRVLELARNAVSGD